LVAGVTAFSSASFSINAARAAACAGLSPETFDDAGAGAGDAPGGVEGVEEGVGDSPSAFISAARAAACAGLSAACRAIPTPTAKAPMAAHHLEIRMTFFYAN
jgi:hypothetical protein